MSNVPIELSNFFLAMQAGRLGADRLRACFAADAVYEEPFSGTPRRHEGRDAIMQAMALGWEMPMENTHLQVDAAHGNGAQVTVEWTCFSTSIPGGQGQGTNQFELRDGQITRLVTTLKGGTE